MFWTTFFSQLDKPNVLKHIVKSLCWTSNLKFTQTGKSDSQFNFSGVKNYAYLS